MTDTVLIRCDFFPGSGAGHLKRCHVLALALRDAGFRPRLVIDDRPGELPLDPQVPIETLAGGVPFDSRTDAAALVTLAHRHRAGLIVGDSYRIGADWVTDLRTAGIRVALLDDLGIGGDADLSVNYAPGAAAPSGFDPETSVFLGGPAYFITDSPLHRAQDRVPGPLRLIAHAGGTGAFDAAEPVYAAIGSVAARHGVEVSWICPDERSHARLSKSGWLSENDTLLAWRKGGVGLWSGYDIVVGPASTSLYEAVLQGALPVSFPISRTQLSGRAPWQSMGHALHLTREELDDPDTAEALLDLAVVQFQPLRAALWRHATDLDGAGARRVATAIAALVGGTMRADIGVAGRRSAATGIRPCDLRDASGFLDGRNAPAVRALSTTPEHVIGWAEHLAWWLNGNTERFVLIGQEGPEAYIWHRARKVNGREYLVGGWFPAGNTPAFTAAVRLLDWQLQYCAERFPNHRWVATMRSENRTVVALNRRYGFVDADPEARAAAVHLFPGTTDAFTILQRDAKS